MWGEVIGRGEAGVKGALASTLKRLHLGRKYLRSLNGVSVKLCLNEYALKFGEKHDRAK
jgi:hypothetical protein